MAMPPVKKAEKRTLTHRSVLAVVKPSPVAAKWLLLLVLVAAAVAASMGHLALAVDFLSRKELTFEFAGHTFTAYDIVKAFIALLIVFWGAAIVSDFMESRISRLKRLRASTRALYAKIAQIITYVIAFLVALDVIGIDFTALAVFSGAVGIGLGFGLQKIASNFMSGMILLFDKTLSPDDLVELADGVTGTIRRTGARFTLVETFDGKEIMVPNEDFITNRVTNLTYSNKRGRINIPVGVAYGSDLRQVQRLLLGAATSHPKCLRDPRPVCTVQAFADNSINFLLSFWVDDVTDGMREPQSDVMLTIWDTFREHGISIPFPQRDLHIIRSKS